MNTAVLETSEKTEAVVESQDVVSSDEVKQVLAWISGEKVTDLPQDLFIPPDAMQVFLEVFEGPLDLLLYLIRKHNLDILDIPVAHITQQYINYIEVMQVFKLEVAADYLEMAAILTEIKSRMLLPRPVNDEEVEEDPRAELVRRLQAYEQIKVAAENIEQMPCMNRDIFIGQAAPPDMSIDRPHPDVDLEDILLAFKDVLKRADLLTAHNISRETLSVREKMSDVLSKLKADTFIKFEDLFNYSEGRLGLIVTLLAILEMAKDYVLEISQDDEPFSPIYVRLTNHDD